MNTHLSSDNVPLIQLQAVEKIYGSGPAEVRAVDNVDMEVADGEFVAIMGPSGSGKSTVMNMLGCLDTPTSGTYRFSGVDVGALGRDQRALLRRGFFGFVFQGFNLLARTSAIENVELPLIYRGMAAGERRRRALDVLKKVGLEGWEDHAPNELSGGQMQRVAIARAMVSDPAVLLADEPTGNLDTLTGQEILELIGALNRDEGITVLMVTHDDHIASYAQRVIRFVDGKIASDTANTGRT